MSMSDVFNLRGAALPSSARVLAFTGREEISRAYRFEVFVLIPHALIDETSLDDAIGTAATLEVQRDDGTARNRWHGVLSEISVLHELPGAALYRVVVVPRLWLLTLTQRSRVYVGDALPAVLEKSLREGGLRDFSLRLQRSYKPLDHVCQYRESHFDFFSRWVEREGLYFHFEHGEDAETLVVSDARPYAPPVGAPVRFLSAADTRGGVEAVTHLSVRRRVTAAEVTLRDYDPLNPTLDLSGHGAVDPSGQGEVRRSGDNFLNPVDGRRYAGLRAQEIAAQQKIYEGRGRAFDLRVGHRFSLVDHPRAALDQDYVVLSLDHRGINVAGSPELRSLLDIAERDEQVYSVSFTAIEETVQYRPERRTPWPRVYGIESATIDGPAESDYAQIDSHGRYKVKVRFDESGLEDGQASTWVRMLQPHGGSPEGFHFPLRKGTEVMLVFLGGDPDRPVITGVAPNALTPSPVTSDNHTLNIVHTGGDNHFELEDSAGAQHIELFSPTQTSFLSLGAIHGHASHNTVSSTDGTGLIHTGGNHDRTVGGAMTEDVVGSVTETYHATQDTTVTGHWTETIHGGGTQTINAGLAQTINAGRSQIINGGDTVLVNGGRTQTVHGGVTSTVNGGETSTLSGGLTSTVNAGITATSNGDVNATVNGTVNLTVSAGIHVTSPAGVHITAPAGYTCVAPGGVTILAPSIHNELHVTWMKVASDSSDWKLTSVGGSAFSFNATGVGIDVKGVSISATGVDISTKGVDLSIGGPEAKTRAVKLGSHGLELKIAGLHVLL
ncbi:MAG: type VI secretion system tip protein VgrG [Myxococcaceae bacterium]|nr:MAG: type VI secretion system tip protein VgrG [Myxococcaceae bacterium]